MLQLNLTAFGDSQEELLNHIVKLLGQLEDGCEFGRTHGMRTDFRGNRVLTTLAKFSIKEAERIAVSTVPVRSTRSHAMLEHSNA